MFLLVSSCRVVVPLSLPPRRHRVEMSCHAIVADATVVLCRVLPLSLPSRFNKSSRQVASAAVSLPSRRLVSKFRVLPLSPPSRFLTSPVVVSCRRATFTAVPFPLFSVSCRATAIAVLSCRCVVSRHRQWLAHDFNIVRGSRTVKLDQVLTAGTAMFEVWGP